MLNSKLELKIKKRSQPEWSLFFVILIPLFCGFLIDVLSFPAAIKYIIDVFLLFLFVLILFNISKQRVFVSRDTRFFYIFTIAFLLFATVVYLVRFQSIFFFLWGVRNNFRFYLAFLAFTLFLNRENVDGYLKMFDIFFWLNSLVCLIQFFVFDLKGDYLGGFFGTEKGCNGYLNIFLVIVAIKAVVYYLNKKENIWLLVSKCGMCFVIAVISELKFFFIEFFVILILGVVITNFSFRKLIIVVVGLSAIFISAAILVKLFPHFSSFLSIEGIIELTSTGGYSDTNQLNRLTTIPVISNNILTTPSLKWFGLGLGNCDTANFEFLKTPFYYDFMYLRYNWFSTSFMFLETGFVGLTFFFGFFVLVAVKGFLILKREPQTQVYCHISIIAAIICIMIAIYNASLRTEAAYLMYFVLALPFIVSKKLQIGE